MKDEFDFLLNKIKKVEQIVEARVKHINNRNKNIDSNKNIIWQKLKSKHFIKFVNYKTKPMTEEMLLVKDFFINGEFDKDLFEILQIKVSWSPKRALGTMSNNGEMNLRKKSINFSAADTVAHEMGHAWHFQLPEIAKINQIKIVKFVVIKYIEKCSKINFRFNVSLKTLKPYIKKYISYYGTKNFFEAFAEIFSIAYSFDMKENIYRNNARKIIEKLNNKIKESINNL